MQNEQWSNEDAALGDKLPYTFQAADSVCWTEATDSTNALVARVVRQRLQQQDGNDLRDLTAGLFDRESAAAIMASETQQGEGRIVLGGYAEAAEGTEFADTESAESGAGVDTAKQALFSPHHRAHVDYACNHNDVVAALLAQMGVATVQLDQLPTQVPISVALADTQTAGRGRLGRAWYNRAGESFIASYVAAVPKSLITGERSGWLTMAAGLAVVDALGHELTNSPALELDPSADITLKWPNDVFLIGRKLGGILTELTASNDDQAVVTFGIGLNLLVDPSRLPTRESTSLQLHYAPLPSHEELRDRLAAGIATALRVRLSALASWPDRIAERMRQEVTARSWTLGRRVVARLAQGGAVEGRAESINADASLTIRLDDGGIQTVTTGDVGVLPE